jgi:membrane protease YdiL (CAAX protease family)
MSFWEKARIRLGALGKAVVWLLYFICADYAVYLAFELLKIDRKIYKGTFNLCATLAVLGVMLIVARLLSIKKEPLIKMNKLMPDQVVCLVIIGLGMLGVVTTYIIVADKIAAFLESMKNAMDDYRESVDRFSDTPQTAVPVWDSILYVITLCFIVPVTEEVTFRGVIFGQLRRGFGPWISVVLSAVLFGLMHGISVHIGYAIACGLIIAACYHLTDSLVAPILLHAVFNIFGSGIANFMNVEAFGIPSEYTTSLMLGINTTSMFMMPVAVLAFAYLVSAKRKYAKARAALEESSSIQVELSGESTENTEITDTAGDGSGIEAKE